MAFTRNFKKTVLILLFISTTIVIAAGIIFFRNNPYLTPQYLQTYFSYFRYRLEFAASSGQGALAAVFFSNRNQTYVNNGEAKAVPVLLYHGVVPKEDGTNISAEKFKEQMFALKKAGYETVSLADLYAFLKGEKKLPDKSFVLTFDDGRKDSYYPVDPILRALDYRAVIFVVASFSITDKSSYYLTKEEVKQMINSGRWEIGSHGNNSHELYPVDADGKSGQFFANRLWLARERRLETPEEFETRIKNDLSESKKELASTFGIEINEFALPFGNLDLNSENFPESSKKVTAAIKENYRLAFVQFNTDLRFEQNTPAQSLKPADNFLVKRIEPHFDWDGKKLLDKLNRGSPKQLPFEDDFFSDQGWYFTWGEANQQNGIMELKPAPRDTGSAAILDGTEVWQNYTFKASVDNFLGSNIYLWARYRNDDNYVACNFGRDRTHIDQRIAGETRVIRGELLGVPVPSKNFEIAIEANGRDIKCLLNGTVMVESFFLNPELFSGGIGIKAWDALPEKSYVKIKSVGVKEIPKS
ncbi:polysaccharide deacetylase family protein [Candidatus Giovannonibacteria bacterium]|nr:polysaccharide deacetylase family protein [Candidatus Giovannonibacteria bacterium]